MTGSVWILLLLATGAVLGLVLLARVPLRLTRPVTAMRAGGGRDGVCASGDGPTVPDLDEVMARFRHELRTPLGSVLGNLDLVLGGIPLNERQRTQLQTARRNAARLQTMLEHGDLPAGAPTGDLAECDLCDVVDERLAAFESGFCERSLALSVEATEMELVVRGDELRLGQAIDIILSNALKYTHDHGWIDVTLRRDADCVIFTCINSGHTLEPREMEDVFDAGRRAAAAVESGVPGEGLGLGIAREIVESHGGTLRLGVWPDRGVTSVQMTFPAVARELRDASAVAAVVREASWV